METTRGRGRCARLLPNRQKCHTEPARIAWLLVPKSGPREDGMPKSMKLLPALRPLCVVPIAVAGGLIVSGPATAHPQELKVTEHATTDAVTDTGAPGDSAGDILTFANEVYDAGDKTKIGTDQGI